MKILVLNSGSSSQKSSLYEIGDAIPAHPPAALWEGKIEWEKREAKMEIRGTHGANLSKRVQAESRKDAVGLLLDELWSGETRAVASAAEIGVVGHRVVHGGGEYQQPTVITPAVRESLARLAIFAPLHNRAELEGMEVVEERLGGVTQVAVFDTAFHSQMPGAAFVYPGPYEWLGQGIRRYGFHGINHQYCAEHAAQILNKELNALRLVTCHLGNGCSLAAIQNGHSVDTTMGFTPLEGLMMGTRSGSVDPGILTYLTRSGKLKAEEMDELLNEKSGLLGISGVSSDMRQIIEAMKAGHARAKLAFDIFVHRLRRGIGEMVAVLGGMEALIFTAGIGENSAEVRAAACEKLGHMGVKLDGRKNELDGEDREISVAGSATRVLVIHAQEDWAIARECWRLRTAVSGGRRMASSPRTV